MRRLLTTFFMATATISTVLPAAADIGPGRIARPSWELEGNRLVLPSLLVVEFEAGTDKLTGRGLRAVLYMTRYLADRTWVTTARIEGHVAANGDGEVGLAQTLSEQRALAVAKLIAKSGVDCQRLLPVGFGTNKPVADRTTPEGRAANTRVELHNAALRDKAIGGMPLDGGGRAAGDPCK